jgi:hypothetical protein
MINQSPEIKTEVHPMPKASSMGLAIAAAPAPTKHLPRLFAATAVGADLVFKSTILFYSP